MTGRCRVKKAVVCVAQLVAALITVHGLSFLSDVYGLLDLASALGGKTSAPYGKVR